MNQNVVVVGIKEKQETALRFAARAAIDRHTNLRIVHCLDIRTAADFVSVPYKTFPPESWRAAGDAVIEQARAFVKELTAHPDVECAVVDGRPFQTLRDEAAAASMLVLGTDATYGFGPIFDGGVTARLIGHSDIPVAVVPERSWPEEITGPVMVAVDTRTLAEGPLRFAFEAASRTDNELHVLHVIPETDMFYRSQSHKIQVSEVLAGWAEEFPDVIVKNRFFFDEADTGCVRASEEASLLVVGRRKTQVLGHPVLSEIARRVHCPCVVVPDEWTGR
jgi:nucleotide-binding universal stress UspA family protein